MYKLTLGRLKIGYLGKESLRVRQGETCTDTNEISERSDLIRKLLAVDDFSRQESRQNASHVKSAFPLEYF